MNISGNGKKIIISVIMIVISVAIMITAIFGWFSMPQDTSSAQQFEISVVGTNSEVYLNILDAPTNPQDEYTFSNAYLGKEYKFEIELVNPNNTKDANYTVFFSGFDDDLDEFPELDILGIMKFRIDSTEKFFREIVNETQNPNKVIVTSGELEAGDSRVIEFWLILATSYMYSDGTMLERGNPNYDTVINNFKNTRFTIESLVVDIN